jgi:predicted PurR-regulated permease PerM
MERRPAATPSAPMADFARRIVVAVLVSVLILAVAFLVWRGLHVFLEAFAGVLLAVFLSALSDWLSRRTGIPYGRSLALVIAALIGAISVTGWMLANRLATQLAELQNKLPQALEQLRDYLGQYAWGRFVLEQLPNAAGQLSQAGKMAEVTGVLSGVASLLVITLVILFVGLFGAAEPGLYKAGLLHLVPPRIRPRALEAVDAVVFNLRWWLVGQVCLMVLMAVTTTAGLWVIGMPLALALGLIAGILELIPYLGPWLSAVPAALIALLISPWHLLIVLALYLALHVLEGYVFLPLVQRRSVLLPPALTLVMQVLFADLLGLLGLFVAAPLTVAVVVLLKMLYVEDTLGDQAVNVPGERGKEAQPAVRAGSPA